MYTKYRYTYKIILKYLAKFKRKILSRTFSLLLFVCVQDPSYLWTSG